MLRIIPWYIRFSRNIKRFMATHIKSHIHKGMRSFLHIFKQTVKHILVMYTPLKTILYSFPGKIIFCDHTLKTHRNIRTKTTKINVPGIIKTGSISGCFQLFRKTGIFHQLARIFNHGYSRIGRHSTDGSHYPPIRTGARSIDIGKQYTLLSQCIQSRRHIRITTQHLNCISSKTFQ